jgi:uncharacterized DUF497 family protein
VHKFNLAEIEGFDWDLGNATKNTKHHVEPEEAEEIFFNKPLLWDFDEKHSGTENRWVALGRTPKRQLAVVFTVRRKMIRIISARPMSKKEKTSYEKEILRS